MSDHDNNKIDKEQVRRRMLEEAKKIRVRKAEGTYDIKNPDLEHTGSWGKKV